MHTVDGPFGMQAFCIPDRNRKMGPAFCVSVKALQKAPVSAL